MLQICSIGVHNGFIDLYFFPELFLILIRKYYSRKWKSPTGIPAPFVRYSYRIAPQESFMTKLKNFILQKILRIRSFSFNENQQGKSTIAKNFASMGYKEREFGALFSIHLAL